MEVEEFKKFQLFLASRGLEVLDTAAFKDFVDNDVSKAIYNRLIEYYLDLMDQAKSYLVEESFYPEKADYLERSKETIVLLFDVCAFAPDNPEKSAIEFLRERFAWAPEPE